MPEQGAPKLTPNLGRDLSLVHKIITRGLNVSIENAIKFTRKEASDQQMLKGYGIYVTSLLQFLSAHHSGENEIAFPYFRDRLPELPFDRLEEEHDRMEGMVERAEEHLEALGDSPAQALRGLETELTALRDMWEPHIAIEERHFDVQRMDEMLPLEEHQRLSGQMAQHSMELAEPDALVVPFALYNLAPAQREIAARVMPPQVIEELVPGPWKEQWAPMQPFLLT